MMTSEDLSARITIRRIRYMFTGGDYIVQGNSDAQTAQSEVLIGYESLAQIH